MLILKDITKNYVMGDTTVEALRCINAKFRSNEFVSILGPSGCGKTTLLNIIGGLDRYTSGDLSINGRSTKEFSDRDWDAYRNHSVGFVFQNYNLIPHQSVLSNVELALTLTGVSKSERRRRAKEALELVGLGDQLRKKPNQMSGGQMQRVAIARALVNDPEILLADEPTGALDTETSVQIMNILKKISSDRLVIMVTHNPDLAEQYSTRIIRLLDGQIVSDSDPCESAEYSTPAASDEKPLKKPSMSIFTAASLSLNNLMTKKARTFLTAFAGSIGIIGIALILSLSNGVSEYINRVQEDTLSTYPLTIESETIDLSGFLSSMQNSSSGGGEETERDENMVYSNDMMGELINSFISEVQSNDLVSFKEFLESGDSGFDEYVSFIKYSYDIDLNIYSADTSGGVVKVNPSPMVDMMFSAIGGSMSSQYTAMASSMYGLDVWEQLLENQELLDTQYDVVAGRWPEKYDEVVLIVNGNNEISDLVLYTLGIKDQKTAEELFNKILAGETYESETTAYSYEELMDKEFRLVITADTFAEDADTGVFVDVSKDEDKMAELVENGLPIKIVGVIRPNEDAVASSMDGAIGYTSDLEKYIIDATENSAAVKAQRENPETDIFTGLPFPDETEEKVYTMDDVRAYMSTLDETTQMQLSGMFSSMTEEQILAMFTEQMNAAVSDATYEGNLGILKTADVNSPSRIDIYASTFEAKDSISGLIEDYNDRMIEEGKEGNVIRYTDYVALLMSSITTIINAISYVLIAFVSISLFVSSIMIGIITYISVLERTKEIGILRSIGASKRDISRVFNAETAIIGLSSGVLGIGVTVLLCIPINIVIRALTGIQILGASLPPLAGVILIAISVLLTLFAGVIPSRIAAKKDPVVALRSE
ncbi:MAG: ABC transporter ATP-binding protein/permease [Clostridiales bacterium]|nr:ABC transporter ATP-binding protein/permease [Clostridiales bacterium]